MFNGEDKKTLIKISKLYYYDSWTQEKIAEKFGVSRPFISKALQKARDEGIVEIIVHDDPAQTSELEKELEELFQLEEVLVVPTRNLNQERVTSAIGRAAAHFALKFISNGDRIGISWGNTLYHMVREFPLEKKEDVKIIPLVGGTGSTRNEMHSNQLAYELSKKLGVECDSLYAPAMVETEELKEQLIALPNISSVLKAGSTINLALVGIGNPLSMSTMERLGYLNETVLQELQALQVVADINSCFIRRDGAVSEHPINQKVIGMSLEQLKRIRHVIGMAFGLHKIDSILAALKGGYVNKLVTDEATASSMIERMKLAMP
ncbi:DNA-binding transcriptional regulator LsrR, DeoR family [Paenibacillus algorifonticola]|uniref:DNA-binding transcriptional regulator LsrR, DeoR family n=1 Tax=Paenibacillus algorifonticola TaxID=684063 RepID=A0A1I2ELF6_9BACL|nr:sugar-binding transcriptional regulator [Paenibacillus algorifonticola]SFE93447.1 DNA-binding transcriptional regulator LsrR, DeoR family [Paenibacillus algorifonticola]